MDKEEVWIGLTFLFELVCVDKEELWGKRVGIGFYRAGFVANLEILGSLDF